MHFDFFFKTMTKLILKKKKKSTGAAISDLFRETTSSKKALQEYVAMGSLAHMGGKDEEVGRQKEGRTDNLFFK